MGTAAAQELRTVILHGRLGREFGRRHRFAIGSPADAIRALCANFPAFERELLQSGQRGVAYRVFVGREQLGQAEEIRNPSGAQAVRIAPVLVGAKRGGLFGIIAGVALIALAASTGGMVLAAEFALATGISATTTLGFVSSIGFALALGGVSQLLAPTPKAPTPYERPENTPSTYFDGPVNTTSQGQAVPVGYGEVIVGSAVISAGITAEDAA